MSVEYAKPMAVAGTNSCYFYHKIDLPTYGTVGGDWDHRADIDAYLGHCDFRNKRALDVGAAGGLLTFAMESRGADVVSFDIDSGENWDTVPHHRLAEEMPAIRRGQAQSVERMKAGYWLAHADLGSQAKVFYGNIYKLPDGLGQFDVTVFGLILTHLRDPFEALHQGARLTRETLIVTGIYNPSENAAATFRPHRDRFTAIDLHSWWLLSIGALRSMLGVLGFEVERIVESSAFGTINGVEEPRTCQTLVAKRAR